MAQTTTKHATENIICSIVNNNNNNNNNNTQTHQGPFNNLLASSAAALCSRLCTHPFDTLKTRIQVSNTPQSLLPTFLDLVRNGGLYRGLPIALALSAPGLSVYLTVYDLSKDAISRHFPHFGSDTVTNHMASGIVAEVTSGLFWTPMEVLKSKQQVESMPLSQPSSSSSASATGRKTVSGGPRPSSSQHAQTNISRTVAAAPTRTLDLVRRIYRQEGFLGFYRGYFITLGVFVPYSMIYFATYEQLKEMARKERYCAAPNRIHAHEDTLPFLTIVACASVACGVAAGVSNMVDVVKTRWQTSVLSTAKETSSTRMIASSLFRQGGLASFTRGMGARVLWMIPSVTISMSMFEWFKAYGFT
ncbi:hypothetical protein BG011_003012 [Mortierella polycephala]|uniref:Mitochondrial carrier n=1 Tax=Mortierella polycephala TaxID=41804 RepID=A0A9P6U4H6_9FUNG|nr:hypothetical protein BG011_003012 [Mortierella polycephala]